LLSSRHTEHTLVPTYASTAAITIGGGIVGAGPAEWQPTCTYPVARVRDVLYACRTVDARTVPILFVRGDSFKGFGVLLVLCHKYLCTNVTVTLSELITLIILRVTQFVSPRLSSIGYEPRMTTLLTTYYLLILLLCFSVTYSLTVEAGKTTTTTYFYDSTISFFYASDNLIAC